MPNSADFYQRLGISQDATDDEVRKAYHEAAHRLHPDVNVEAGATELFLEIKEAYEILSDPKKRRAYDGVARDVTSLPVRIGTHFSRETLPWMTEEQLIYALIEMEVLADQLEEAETATTPINISLVLDCSTSMKGARLDILKASALELIQQLRPQDILSVIAFNDRAETIIPATPQANNRKNKSRVRLLQTRGGTEIFQGLNAGVSEVKRNISPYYINHVILVTDGHTYGDEAKCQELAKEAAILNIGISGLGIGGNWNDVFLDSLTKTTGGSTFYINDPRDIRKLLKQKFNDLGQVQVEGIKLNFQTGPGVVPNYAYRLEPDPNTLPLTSPISIGNIPKGNRLSIILEFLISPIKTNIKKVLLAEGSITFIIPNQGKTIYRIPLILSRTTSENTQQHPPNKAIIEAMSRLTLFRMQEQARKELTDGNYQEASKRLQNMATHFLSRGENGLAKTAMIEASNIQSNKMISRDGQKRIKYGTQALFFPISQKKIKSL
jgi:Ca-activated chloride channel family protein